jgi:hypothetical protein
VATIALVAASAWFARPAPELRSTTVVAHRPTAPPNAIVPPPEPAIIAQPSTPSVHDRRDAGPTVEGAGTAVARGGTGTHRAAAPARPPADDDTRPRQLQFVTPGGTRIVWVLSPKFTLAPGAPQQEDPRWSGE